MIRISGGTARGRRLRTPRGARPTLGRVKQSLFDILAWRLPGCRFLDLFAGSGAVGIEALSRGAVQAVFVESHAQQAALVRENLARSGLEDRAKVFRGEAARVLDRLAREPEMRFDVVFLDPPYAERETLERALATLAAHESLIADDGIVVVERARREVEPQWPADLRLADSRVFGDTVLDFLRSPCGAGED